MTRITAATAEQYPIGTRLNIFRGGYGAEGVYQDENGVVVGYEFNDHDNWPTAFLIVMSNHWEIHKVGYADEGHCGWKSVGIIPLDVLDLNKAINFTKSVATREDGKEILEAGNLVFAEIEAVTKDNPHEGPEFTYAKTAAIMRDLMENEDSYAHSPA